MRLETLNLYAVRVYSDKGLVGSFFAAAVDLKQARAVGEQWAHDRGFVVGRIEVRRHADPRPVCTFSS